MGVVPTTLALSVALLLTWEYDLYLSAIPAVSGPSILCLAAAVSCSAWC